MTELIEYIHQEMWQELAKDLIAWKNVGSSLYSHEWSWNNQSLEVTIWVTSVRPDSLYVTIHDGHVLVQYDQRTPTMVPLADPGWKRKVLDLVAGFYRSVALHLQSEVQRSQKRLTYFQNETQKIEKALQEKA